MSDDRKRGWFRKYRVERLNDPDGKHADCDYFVLDIVHDKFARPALLAYAKACESEYPALARDLRLQAAAMGLDPRLGWAESALDEEG